MRRSRAPSMALAIASGRPSSRKKSAGPPMPKDVREASGSSAWTPGSSRSHARLDFVRQLIAQLLDVARAHQEHQVVRSHDLVQRLLCLDEVADVSRLPDLVGQVCREDTRDVVLACAVRIQDEPAVGALEGAREI